MCAGQWLEIHIGVSDLQKTLLDVHGTTKTMLNVWILQAHHDYSWLMIFHFDHKKSWNAAYWLNPSSLHVSMKTSRCHCAVDTAAPSKALRHEHFRDSEIPLAILPVFKHVEDADWIKFGTLFCNHQLDWTLWWLQCCPCCNLASQLP